MFLWQVVVVVGTVVTLVAIVEVMRVVVPVL